MQADHAHPAAPSFAGHVDVGDGHSLYVEVSGPEDGLAAIVLHGGPGSGSHPGFRQLFDTQRYRVVLFDQRGAGRSRPRGGREHNTTAHLIADIERLRTRFGIADWLVVGGSWGATLALAYAERHPEHVRGLVLRSVFLGTRAEIETAFCETLPRFHPELHEDFLAELPPGERSRPLDAYWARILDPDPAVHRRAARAWYATERILSEFQPRTTRLSPDALADTPGPLPVSPFLEAHYFSHDCFLEPNEILHRAQRLEGLPGTLIQPRYDLLCPPATAHALARAWPTARIVGIPQAGHTMSDGGTVDALRRAVARHARDGDR
ncbi:proline iminopeptidase [Palleronia aestuarii]|uniref:Proline iminopeptidase n=1 Tax=Palleronia aestuarii TaxID=568105 RepID=A0A2W7NH71_9RHOB|nr:prolyl aminopeptidase [Palleronia aestuarii]PZX16024.1 proline iminopeptidase [Palleronia aestuarii]